MTTKKAELHSLIVKRARRLAHAVKFSFVCAFLLCMKIEIASATPLSESALFARCYSQITGHPVPVGHPVMAQVKAGQVTGLAGCFSILDKAKLSTSGNLSNSSDAEAVAVLGQFYSFHRTWFSVNTPEQLSDFSREYVSSAEDFYDLTEPALALTKAMFGTHKYSELLTTMSGVRAIRRPNATLDAINGYTVNSPSRRVYFNNGGNLDSVPFGFRSTIANVDADGNGSQSILINAPLIQSGDLIGVRPETESLMVPNLTLMPLATAFGEVRGDQSPGMIFPYNAYQGAGAGILGYPIYMLSYWGQDKNTLMNGTTKLPRRWAITSLQTFLCATMPDLRAGDVTQFVDSTSSAPFRQQTACLGCHAAQDQMAYTLRNFTLGFSDYETSYKSGTGQISGKTTELLPRFAPSQASVGGWPSQPVANFQLQTPSGRFYYRTLSGQLINQSVADLNGLGQAMVATDDYYQCAVKHYFQFLTGIQVPLFDRQNPANSTLLQTLSPQSVVDRQYIEALAAQFRNDPNQSLMTMVKAILSSPYYRDSNYRP